MNKNHQVTKKKTIVENTGHSLMDGTISLRRGTKHKIGFLPILRKDFKDGENLFVVPLIENSVLLKKKPHIQFIFEPFEVSCVGRKAVIGLKKSRM